MVYAVEGIANYAHRARQFGIKVHPADLFVIEALFTTVTNVNFDPDRIRGLILKAAEIKESLKGVYLEACRKAGKNPEDLDGPALWSPADDWEGLLAQGKAVAIDQRAGQFGARLAGHNPYLRS